MMMAALEAKPELLAALTTLALVAAQWITAHLKGKRRDRSSVSALTRIELKIDSSIDEQRCFVEEQRETNRAFDKRIDAVSAHVIGPDGKNGIRSRVDALENAERERERNPLHPSQIGAFDRRTTT